MEPEACTRGLLVCPQNHRWTVSWFGPQNQVRRPEATETVIRELREASRRGARGVIMGLASILTKAAVEACPLDED